LKSPQYFSKVLYIVALPRKYTLVSLPSKHTTVALPSKYTLVSFPNKHSMVALPSQYRLYIVNAEDAEVLEDFLILNFEELFFNCQLKKREFC
jgi:hypothetical protein